MKRTKFRWVRRYRWFFLILIVFVVMNLFYLFSQEIKLKEMQKQIDDEVTKKNELLEAMNQLETQVNQIDTDDAKESLARRKLNMIRQDEILYIIKYKYLDGSEE